MVMIPQRDIDAIRSQADIVDVISSYLPVEKKEKIIAASARFMMIMIQV